MLPACQNNQSRVHQIRMKWRLQRNRREFEQCKALTSSCRRKKLQPCLQLESGLNLHTFHKMFIFCAVESISFLFCLAMTTITSPFTVIHVEAGISQKGHPTIGLEWQGPSAKRPRLSSFLYIRRQFVLNVIKRPWMMCRYVAMT